MSPLFVVLLAGHLVGDFIFQSDAMARDKCEGRGLIRHSLVVTLVSWVLLGAWPFRAAWVFVRFDVLLLVLGFATLSDVHWTASGHVVLMTLVGGLGTLSGPLVGSAVVVLLENKLGEIGSFLATLTSVEWFNTLGESVTMVTGLIFVICVLAFRRGIMGEIIAWLVRRKADIKG